jgi:hypothetical protein
MVAAVKDGLSHARELIHTYGTDAHIHTEQSVSMEWAGVPDMFGTADIIIDQPFGTLVVFDYKYGMGNKVDPTHNPQLMAYALMAGGKHIKAHDTVILAISQPRVTSSVQCWQTTPEELLAWKDDVLLPTVQKITQKVMDFNPSNENCKYCKAAEANICQAYTADALAVAQMDFQGVMTQPVITPELVNKIYPQLPMLASFIKNIESMAHDMCCAGQLNGYKMVYGRSSRHWEDEGLAELALSGLGVDPYEQKLISPAKAEKLGKHVKDAIKDLIVKADGNPVIAPVTDKRPTIEVDTAHADFNQFRGE